MSEKKPNILLITTDQQRFDTIAALGNQHIYTPHLDWLVDEGITYNRCYTSCPLCMPSRATIMTGMQGYETGLGGNDDRLKPMEKYETLPAILTKNGYQTRAQGKMHFSPVRANYGFEHMEISLDYYREMRNHPEYGTPKDHGVGENETEPVISTVHESHSLTHWTVKRSIDFLETRDETRPFFLWTSFAKPHPPFDPCYNYWALYQNMTMPDPVVGDWSSQTDDLSHAFKFQSYEINHTHRYTPEQITQMRRAYYACITQIDYSLGLLFARMRELELLDNTWIVFTSDHGDMMGDHNMGAKIIFFEGSAHIPLIIRPPQRAFAKNTIENNSCDALVDLGDIMPTILEMAGVKAPSNVQGTDILSPQITKDRKNHTFYGQSLERYYLVLSDNIKYMFTTLGGHELLFDLKTDPYEQHNLINDPAYAKELKMSRKKLIKLNEKYMPHKVKDGQMIVTEKAPKGPHEVPKWPGMLSPNSNEDTLH